MIRYLRLPLVLALVLCGGCKGRPGPITVADNVVSVQNQTTRDWQNVVITVNDHFRGGAAKMAAGSRMSAPLSQFRTAFGQQYDAGRQHVFKIEVTATDASGEPVKLLFDPNRR